MPAKSKKKENEKHNVHVFGETPTRWCVDCQKIVDEDHNEEEW